jgi:hypothetical protein
VKRILDQQFSGFYLLGSLAAGDFALETSDIDFLTVSEKEIPPSTFSALKDMHAGIFGCGLPWSQKLEGAYLPKAALRRHDPGAAPVPWLGSDGHFALERLGNDWVLQRWILRERGLRVAGPPLAGWIDPIGPDELRQAVLGSLWEWWTPPFPSPQRFESDGYRAYAVLTMCRSLYVLERGAIASKPLAARWAREILAGEWIDLIDEALAWRPGRSFDENKTSLDFISFVHTRIKTS